MPRTWSTCTSLILPGCIPAGGNVDFKTFLHGLWEVDYKGYITTECVPVPTAYECAKRGFEYMKAMEKIVEIERGASRFQ